VPVPRRFDRRPPERDTTRINERIRVPEVRLIDETGQQVGILKTPEALTFAQERDLDLVEVAPEARPPVCRVLDYSKYKYELAQKQKAARKHQQQITIREIKFRPKIAQNDYDTKKGHVTRFLKHRDKVKITIMFRGREVTHPERGEMLLNRLAEELAELAIVEQRPIQDGRNMTMMLGPSKAILAEGEKKDAAAAAARDGGKPEAPAAAEPASAVEPETQAVEAPAPAEESKPAAEPETQAVEAPAPAEESKPAAEPETQAAVAAAEPAVEAGDAPAAEAEPAAAPAKKPAAKTAKKPTAKAAKKPAAKAETAPSAEAETAPAAEADGASNGAEAKPKRPAAKRAGAR
jgi:translation initiation factor IF-3